MFVNSGFSKMKVKTRNQIIFLSLVLVLFSSFILSGCDNPVQNKNNTVAGPVKTVPHPSPDDIGNYLWGTWSWKGQLFVFDKVTRTGKFAKGAPQALKFFQRGNVEIFSLLDKGTDNLGTSFTLTRKGPNNMAISFIESNKVPPDTLKIYNPYKNQGIDISEFDHVKVK